MTEEESEDLYLSDVHVEIENYEPSDGPEEKNRRLTRIFFQLPVSVDSKNEDKSSLDEDGDIDLKRRSFMTIEHEMKTSLGLVGLQLWRASFYLVDYLLNNLDLVQGKTIIDLGAGLGLTTLFASLYAERVYCTDLPEVVSQARRNLKLNHDIIKQLSVSKEVNVVFKELDWFKDFEGNVDDELSRATVFIASDVVYDDSITDAFMRVLYKLMVSGHTELKKVCLIANERRVNFSCESMTVRDCAYSHFAQCANELNEFEDVENGVRFSCRLVESDFNGMKQFVTNYKRNKLLYMWRIECEPV